MQFTDLCVKLDPQKTADKAVTMREERAI